MPYTIPSVGTSVQITGLDFSACNGYLRGALEVELLSQSQDARTSTMKITLSLYKTTSTATTDTTFKGSVTVGQSSVSYSYKIASLATSHVVVYTGTHVVQHNTDGTASPVITATATYGSRATGEDSETVILPTLPVNSTLRISPDSGTLIAGQTSVEYTIDCPDSSWKHVIRARNTQGNVYVIAELVSGVLYHKATLSTAIAQLFPSAQSETLYFDCISYTATGTQLGTYSITRLVSLPETVGPTVGKPTVTAVNAAGSAVSYGYIAGVTYLKVVFSVTDTTGSTVTNAACVMDGYTYPASINGSTATVLTTHPIGNSGTVTVRVTANNARGYSGSNYTDISVLAYAQPYIRIFGVARSDANGNPAQQGTYAKVDYSYDVTQISNYNSYSLTISYKTRDSSTWTNALSLSSQTTNWSHTSFIVVPGLSASATYDFRLMITDALTGEDGRATKTAPLGTDTVIIDLKENGEGIAFGKLSEHDKTVDFGWSVMFTGGITPAILEANTSINTVRNLGFYIGSFTNGISGGPSSASGSFGLLVLATGASSVTQILSTETVGTIPTVYVRNVSTSGQFSSWYKISLTSA